MARRGAERIEGPIEFVLRGRDIAGIGVARPFLSQRHPCTASDQSNADYNRFDFHGNLLHFLH
jgi:hypothetical protein